MVILILITAASSAAQAIVKGLMCVLLASGVDWCPPDRDPVHYVSFLCPLCRELGHTVTLRAELDPTPTVTDLQGACAHAAAFGELEQTIEEAWTLIEAALEAGDTS